jgi:large subunit ribosomal protein L10
MPLTKEQKEKIVKKLKENIANQKAMVFVSVKGLKASELFNLRKQLKESNCLLSVAKKTLLKIAFKENKTELNEKELEGQVALIFGFEDELAPAKTAYDFSLKNENLKILGGFLENEFRSREEVVVLAKIPSKQELLAKVIGSIKAPISGFANVLQGNIKGLVYLLSNIK